jgi:HK97 family phage major capsid protein
MSNTTPIARAGASAARLFAGPGRFAPVADPPNDQGAPDPVAAMAQEIRTAHAKAFDAVKEVAEKAMAEAAKVGAGGVAAKEKIDEALVKMNDLGARLRDLEQKSVGARGEPPVAKTVGEQFVEAEHVKTWLSSGVSSGRTDLRIKATLTTDTADAAGAVGDAIRPTRLPGILPLPQRRMTVRDLISPGRMDGGSLEYVKETGFTNAAGMVAEAAAKPQSDIKLDLFTTAAKVVAHWMKASRQALDDVAQLRSIIDQRLLYGLAYKEEQQLLAGDGQGQNLLGILPQATAFAAPIALAAETSIDRMRLAQLQAALAEYPATGHVMNPIDWAWIETLKDSTGRYIIGNPQGSIVKTLWGLPVVESPAMEQDKFLTGAFRLGAQVFDRWDARVEVGYVNDDFTRNLVTVLAEERLALAVYRPEAFVYGDFGRVA